MQVPEVIDDGSNTEVDIQERVTVCIAESSQCFVNHLKKVIMIFRILGQDTDNTTEFPDVIDRIKDSELFFQSVQSIHQFHLILNDSQL
jgi:hypothetical protein